MLARCRSCDAPIFWVQTERGKTMPMDSEPSSDGTFRLENRVGQNALAIYVGFKTHGLTSERLYVSHYATCRDAVNWRKGWNT